MAHLRFAYVVVLMVVLALAGTLTGCQGANQPEPPDALDGGGSALDASQTIDSVHAQEAGLDGALDEEDAESMLALNGPLSYQRHVRPLLEAHCLSCHLRGGAAQLPLDSYEAVRLFAPLVVSAVESGRMPPFPADPSCRPLRDVPMLPRDARVLLRAWQRLGYPEGQASDYQPPAVPRAPAKAPPTRVMATGVGYAPRPRADEYRCFVLGGFAEDTYVTGLEILPERRAQVRSVQVQSVAGSERARIEQLDAAEPGLGYGCAGGAPAQAAGELHTLFSYRPGSRAVVFQPGDAAYVAAGSLFVMRVHYDTRTLRGGENVLPDQTRVALWTLPRGELPEQIVYRAALSGNNLSLPAGNPHVVESGSSAAAKLSTFGPADGGVFVPAELIGAAPNANQLATRMSAALRHASGSRECLVEVPHWEFAFQLDYMFMRPLAMAADDALDFSCEYDNSDANQPIVDGKRQSARNVVSGERIQDELCLHYFWLRIPRDLFLSAQTAH